MKATPATQSNKQLAMSRMREGRFAEAIQLLQKSLDQSATDPEAYYLVGCSCANLKQWNEAVDAFHSSIRLAPRVAQSHFALAGALLASGRVEEAIASLETTLELAETKYEAHMALADILMTKRKFDEAAQHYRRAVELNPKSGETHFGLARLELEHGAHHKAHPHLQRAAQLSPNDVRVLCALAVSLASLARNKEAEAAFRQAMRIDPNYIEARCGLSRILNVNGEHGQALALIEPLLQKAIAHPALAAAFGHLCRHTGRCEEAVARIEETLKQPSLNRSSAKHLHYLAGKILDSMDRYEEAFMHFKDGNELIKPLYDSLAHTKFINDLIGTFSPELFMRIMPVQDADKRPVFIVGMPRSGTSLTEQILAAHPKVFAAGELDVLSNITREMSLQVGGRSFPLYMGDLVPEDIDRMSSSYLAHLNRLSKKAVRVTDKMPHNFYLLGLIQLLFPGARIIHCRRNPMDTCLSIYFQDFNEEHQYAKDLHSIGTHYHEYIRLMEHWRQVLSMPIFDLQYEDMVSNQEDTTRRLLEFCELAWDERCLQFHTIKRTVDTASHDQVRQPLYSKSVNRWRHYEPFLDDLKAGLNRDF